MPHDPVRKREMERFLEEDLGFGDITTDLLVEEKEGTAVIRANEDCVLAGLEEAAYVFSNLGARALPNGKDGDDISEGVCVLTIEGDVRHILYGERLALNLLMRMSGIATVTKEISSACRSVNPNCRVAATRKTTPGFRFYEKKAVVLGGGDSHRYRLDDAILIKDNHIVAVGSVGEAVRRAKAASFTKKIEIEVESLAQAEEAVRAGADIILLDNMSPDECGRVACAVRSMRGSVLIEASGGITPMNAPEYAKHVDIVSLGWITHSVRAIGFSLDML